MTLNSLDDGLFFPQTNKSSSERTLLGVPTFILQRKSSSQKMSVQ